LVAYNAYNYQIIYKPKKRIVVFEVLNYRNKQQKKSGNPLYLDYRLYV